MPTWAYILCAAVVLIAYLGGTWWLAGDALDWED